MSSALVLLSLVVFLPSVGALALAFFPRKSEDASRWFALATTVVTFLLTAWMAIPGDGKSAQFQLGVAEMQNVFNVSWLPSFGVQYYMGVDGISFPLVLLTTFLSVLAMGAAWPIAKHVKGYCILFLLLETGMLGAFVALDFFLFFIFWEVMLLPMYFLIGIWGGPRREYAAIKFFLYTMLGGVCMVVALLALYFNSDVTKLIGKLSPAEWRATHLLDAYDSRIDAAVTGDARTFKAVELMQADIASGAATEHTFNILAMQQLGQKTDAFDAVLLGGKSIQWWAFVLLFIGFVIKVPSVPFHTWLPDAHVEAPTPISMILAGVLLKLGGYGLIRICYPICPDAAHDLAYFVVTIGVVSMIYGAFAALNQKDFKRLVAYSSVSHMGYVVAGLGVWSAAAATGYDADYWKMGMNGAMFQMIAHGISSAGMFFMVGVLYDRVHHRNLNEFGGLFAKMPVYCCLAWVIFLAGVGLPGLCGFIGEACVTLSVWKFSPVLAVVTAFTVILTAGYILWAFQRVYLGAEYKGPHEEALVPSTWRERAIGATLVAAAILFGVLPYQTVFRYMTPSVDKVVADLVAWQRRDDAVAPAAAMAGASTEPEAATPAANAVSANE
ncbi:MAG: NADH-quinone oxidoreductase subunit M [Planctomycetota bacterium]|nr:MAG: NADH-quinone oxidoreductase subunit M [Planctomycetota bacterium]